MSRAAAFRDALARCRDRERQAQAKFALFAAGCDMADAKVRARRRDLRHSWE